MPRLDVKSLTDGQAVDEVYLLAEKQVRSNRVGDLFLLAQLRDRTGQISGLLWNVREGELDHLASGHYVRIRAKCQLYQGNLQLILSHVELVPSDQVDAADFIPASTQDAARLLARLREILLGLTQDPLRLLMQVFLDDEAIVQRLSRAPAGIKLHHAFHGGLLEHIVNVLESSVRVADFYPNVDHELLLAGVFLHDLGKIRELSFDDVFAYTDEGQLIGHLVIGVEMLNEKVPAAEAALGHPFPRETLLRLKHMILSHHGSYEFGSPKLPMTPEAIALHHLDNLDAKTNEFQSVITGDPNSQSPWTPFNTSLQRKLFKGAP